MKHKVLKALSALACFSMLGGMLADSPSITLGGMAIGVATLLAYFDQEVPNASK